MQEGDKVTKGVLLSARLAWLDQEKGVNGFQSKAERICVFC